MTLFSDFGLAQPIQKALVAEGYTTPTPIQSQAIPVALEGRDVLGIAQTGTGKTAAFALPILHRLAGGARRPAPRTCRALVLTPTRELAGQIAESFRTYGRNLRLTARVVYGGVPLGAQERGLAPGVDVLVATPGRLLDLIDRRALSLREVEILVLDEADQMLDLGFIHALKRIVKLLPRERQSLFFSATMPKTIAALAGEFLRDPTTVAVTPVATTAERVEQRVVFVPGARKQALLAALLKAEPVERALVFTRTKHGADKVVRGLAAAGIEASAIHGNKSQSQRERALAAFRDGRAPILVATDIAARGIDVDGVSHVINFELPNVPESYVHRIGRTARAGASGLAISFCNGEERAYLRDIERLTRLKVPVMPAPEGFDLGREEPQAAEREPRRDGRRPQGRAPQQQSRPQGQQPRSPRSGFGAPRHGDGGTRHGQGRPAQRSVSVGPGQRDGGSIGWLNAR